MVVTAAAALSLCAVVILHNPIRIGFYRLAADYCWHRGTEHEDPSPLEALFFSYSEGSNEYGRSYEYGQGSHQFLARYHAYRDKLVALGYLVHREFVFDHVKTGTPDAKDSQVFRLSMERFPDNIHTLGSWSDKPEPFRLQVWDRPDKIPEWEAFVREVDRPDSAESGTRE